MGVYYSGRVEKPVYKEKEKRVYINAGQYFEGIEKEVWNYQIGGYQVMDKWLKSRKGRALSYEDIVHYCKIAAALQNTIAIQKMLDTLYSEAERSTLWSPLKNSPACHCEGAFSATAAISHVKKIRLLRCARNDKTRF